jgi:hypothetical protein
MDERRDHTADRPQRKFAAESEKIFLQLGKVSLCTVQLVGLFEGVTLCGLELLGLFLECRGKFSRRTPTEILNDKSNWLIVSFGALKRSQGRARYHVGLCPVNFRLPD